MSVWRTTRLPRAPARGRLWVPEQVARPTLEALRTFQGTDGERHEGLVFWTGRRTADGAIVTGAIVPDAAHEPLRVIADERAIGFAARAARLHGTAIVAQVHSHPGDDTRHSDGDDRLILMPFEGMFSLVVANYGDGSLTAGEGVGLHQFQQGRWVAVEPMSAGVLTIVPTLVDLRSKRDERA